MYVFKMYLLKQTSYVLLLFLFYTIKLNLFDKTTFKDMTFDFGKLGLTFYYY